MNRTRITIAGLALALSASIAGAQQTTPPPGGQSRAGQQGDSARQGRHAARGERRARGKQVARQARAAAFRGIDLTEAQRTQLRAVREQFARESQPIVGRMRSVMQEARAARQRGDTVAARAAFQRTAGDRAALKAIGERQRSAALAVLTPEQRAKVEAKQKARQAKAAQRDSVRQSKRAAKKLQG